MNLFAIAVLCAAYTADPDSVVRGVYINPWQGADREFMDRIFARADSGVINAIVVDCKSDFGYLTYASEIPLARKIKAVRPYLDLDSLLARARTHRVKFIARIVCYRDNYLAGYGKFGMRDETGDLWRDKTGSNWTNPYIDSVGDYLAEVVAELKKRGVSSVAFDYIRFPTDGAVDRIRLTRVKGPRYQPIVRLLKKVRDRAPGVEVGACVYGFTAWYDLPNLGQVLGKLGDHLDVIYPMLYPSHFPSDFKREVSEYWRNYWIYFDSVKGAFGRLPGRVRVVPFVQGFDLLAESFDYDYVLSQLDGSIAAGASGFLIWNPGCEYATSWTPIGWVYNSIRDRHARMIQDTRTTGTGHRYPGTDFPPSLFQ